MSDDLSHFSNTLRAQTLLTTAWPAEPRIPLRKMPSSAGCHLLCGGGLRTLAPFPPQLGSFLEFQNPQKTQHDYDTTILKCFSLFSKKTNVSIHRPMLTYHLQLTKPHWFDWFLCPIFTIITWTMYIWARANIS